MRPRAIPIALGAALLTLVLLAPLASGAPGDRLTLHLDEVRRVDPERERAVNVTVTLCAGGGAIAPAPGPRDVVLSLTHAPGWLRWEVTPATLQFTPVLPNDCQRQAALLRLNATAAAPGFEPASFTLQAAIKGDGMIAAEENVTFMSGFHGDLAIRGPAEPLHAPQGGTATTHVLVQNRGNAPTRVRVEAVGAPRGVAVNVNGDATLAPFGGGATDHAFPVTVVVGDGAPTEPFTVRLLVTSNYPYDPTIQGEGGIVEVRVVPGPPDSAVTQFTLPSSPVLLGIAAVGGACVAVGLLLRRRRRRSA